MCPKHPEKAGERNVRNRGCIGCNRDKMRARRAANPEYHRKATRVAYEKWYPKNREKVLAKGREERTGVTDSLFKAVWAVQGGLCALCGVVLERRAHADHCHDSKKFRGILCGPCNQAEGLIRRSGLAPELFGKRLSAYLSDPPANALK